MITEAIAKSAAIAHLETNAALSTLLVDVVECLTEHPEAIDLAEHQLTEACEATRSAALLLWLHWKGIKTPMADSVTSANLVTFDDWLWELADKNDLPHE